MLEAQGWAVVRAAGSLGVFDLVAISRAGVRLVQAKTNRGPSRAESARLAAFDNLPPNATRELWLFRDSLRNPQIEVLR
ncbi:MAG: hypothetical protein DMG32_03635 [Acidobacteria bacterium]|nr:MAG: hypothetical protein DMG32_03635 [Acidobacteriota bacterium]